MIVKATSVVPIAGACGIIACLTVASIVICQWLPPSKKQQKLFARHLSLWFARSLGRNSFVLKRVKVPISVFPVSDCSLSIIQDQEGLVECSIFIEQGKIGSISTVLDDPSWSTHWTVDCYGSILIPCFVDAHTHLVKTQTVPRIRNVSGTMGEAFFKSEVADQPRWGIKGTSFVGWILVSDVLYTMAPEPFAHTWMDAIQLTNVCGVRSTPFDAIRDKYRPSLSFKALPTCTSLWSTPMATEHANTASAHENVVLGAYVGPPDDETTAAMDALFGHAHRLSMDCDLHIDETNDPECCALRNLCASLSKARAAGYQGRVGHCSSLSLQDQATQDFICTQLAELQAFVICNPFSNLGLQDRKGSEPPLANSSLLTLLEHPIGVV
ncbi:amidohydrolase-like protein [Fragilaria crotonensis]|nr:amidohydrolase-like protein [Fragilaria crotonensis]